MVKRKGLFHIIEIVIISLVMFSVILQMAYIPRATPDWDISKLMVQGRDLLFSMDAAGVDWSSETEVGDFVENALNNSFVRYRLELLGAPQKTISVGCLCDGGVGCTAFCSWLDGMLDPVSFNGLPVDFTVDQTASISSFFDVMVSSQGLAGLESDVDNYLSGDGGFVLFRNLASQDFTDYGNILRYRFSVDEYTSPGSGDISFPLGSLEGTDYYRIARYFSAIPNGTGDNYNVTHVFEGFATDAVIELDNGTVVLETSNSPACIAYEGVMNGTGRSAWISGGSTSLDDKDVMLTALVVWSSKHRRLVAGSSMNVERASVSMYRVPEGGSDYMFQPMEALITLGYWY